MMFTEVSTFLISAHRLPPPPGAERATAEQGRELLTAVQMGLRAHAVFPGRARPPPLPFAAGGTLEPN